VIGCELSAAFSAPLKQREAAETAPMQSSSPTTAVVSWTARPRRFRCFPTLLTRSVIGRRFSSTEAFARARTFSRPSRSAPEAPSLGRAFLYGLGAMGEDGVLRALEIIRNELDITMALCGKRTISEVNREILLR
jgi:FMN-dependent dehydrogenase